MEKIKNKEVWCDSIDFNQLYRIKGKQGVWTPFTQVNKSGMILMGEWLSKDCDSAWVNRMKLECLSSFIFYRLASPALRISDVFRNINKNYNKIKSEEFDNSILEILVPNYDPNEFKLHHAKKVIKWYECIHAKYQEATVSE
jgi:hypothetical protein